MKKIVLLLFALGIGGTSLIADTPAAPFPYVATASWGMVYFKMVPRLSIRWDPPDGVGTAYRVRADGSDEILWRTEGWYSFEVFISRDGMYLVAMGPWNEGTEPKKEDMAVAFYREGKLLKQYSTADLVKDKSKVLASISHYRWLARDVDRMAEGKRDPDAELRIIGVNTFRLKTCDAITYEFDLTTGEIKKKKP